MNQGQMEIKTPEYVSLQFQVAGLGSRAAAFIIDQILLNVVNILALIVVFLIMDGMSPLPFYFFEDTLPIAITIIALFIINWGYFFAFEFFSGGRTIGKKLIGIRVIQENGHSITLLSSFIRNLLRIIDTLPTAYFLGIIMVFFHSKHKRLGDLVAGTIVVHERKAKRKKKLTPIEKEIASRAISKDDLIIDEWTIKAFTARDWKLMNTYAGRFTQLPLVEKNQLTRQISEILLPKIGQDVLGKNEQDLENILLVLYLNLRDEWEFDM
ncbi:RDD family protein [Neobacillus vireti]|uniref:RDD domain containing protein n=1 Tax=Neobacillus vireti LMG 21834 TaxID=1131730 RepID=A0AB94IP60_9BACI|nr:RDD family protein [Neobacillus vireti]ETI68866.1 RDD domain containing protein [Neobacillus vireti LMG 21834]KLT15818.1 RDD domain containing protein [Neobacillus vireti]